MTPSTLPTIKEKRFKSPAITPQALAWDGKQLWMSSRDLRRIYKLDPPSPGYGVTGIDELVVTEEIDPPGIAWAALAIDGSLRFTIGEVPNDDRYVYRYEPGGGFSKMFACPEFTGSYLSYNGEQLYLSQWYKGHILQVDPDGNILRKIDVGGEISGHTFVDGIIYVLHGTEENGESWTIARLDPREEVPEVKDLATIPFACRSLTFDGEHFWSNHRAGNEIVSFSLPEV
jgi:hypothetical protein